MIATAVQALILGPLIVGCLVALVIAEIEWRGRHDR